MKVKLLKKLRKEANAEFGIAVNENHCEIWSKSMNSQILGRFFYVDDLDEMMRRIRDLRRIYIKKLVEERKLIRELKRKYKDENWRCSSTQKKGKR